ncbi:hypothetical protein LCGC14_0546280 [marine sediment metagenome]|uniref:SpoVT-AbrB domain-containing protein n=1 Tax=marine sediment metagenome TaxID=412755 RepID=A0A0F9UZF8_9ZZZZ|nr:hypothetical protein [bacterium]
MNGKTTKYRKYKGHGSGTITVPIAIAKALNWGDGDEIHILFEAKGNKKGIFLFKKEGKS